MRMCKMFLISYSGFVHIVEKYIKELYGVQWLSHSPQFKCVSCQGFLEQTNVFAEVWLIINLITEAFINSIVLGASVSFSWWYAKISETCMFHNVNRRGILGLGRRTAPGWSEASVCPPLGGLQRQHGHGHPPSCGYAAGWARHPLRILRSVDLPKEAAESVK